MITMIAIITLPTITTILIMIIIITFDNHQLSYAIHPPVFLYLGFSKPNQSESHEESPVEGSKFVLQFDAYANYKPKAIWFKDGQQLNENSTFNFTTETIRSNLSSETLYRFTLIKQIASRNDSGLYEGFIEYINKHVLIRDFLLHIKCK